MVDNTEGGKRENSNSSAFTCDHVTVSQVTARTNAGEGEHLPQLARSWGCVHTHVNG